jgi:iron complex outermembrane receptor protein
MRFKLALSTASTIAIGVAAIASPAFAQSTGSIEAEREIVVTGTRTSIQAVAGISAPDAAKSRAVLTAENIQRQGAGQTILDTINQVPGVSFQNNDAYGSSGGTLNIRGFSSDRVSLTFDGVPLNDSGNYAIYSNQQIDPELIEQVNVNLGTTDVDSPTASAAGGTVNYRTKVPDKDFGILISGAAGEFEFRRVFTKIETGELNKSGTRAFIAASRTGNNNPFNNYGKVNKQQYNARIYQPLGGSDFISLAGHYNQNRNNFFGSLPLRWDTTQSPTNSAPRVVGSGSSNRFPRNNDEREYLINYPCQTDAAQAGAQDVVNSCGTEFDRRYNPSNTGNVRLSSRFQLNDSLVLTVDPSYQYVKANGGGTVTGREGVRIINGTTYTGFIGGNYYFGADLNGDGDLLDTCRIPANSGSACSSTASASNVPGGGVTLLAPSQTQTHRIGVIAGLRWILDENNTVRLNYTYDRARHRQTGELIGLYGGGEPLDVFPVNSPLADASGTPVQKRDRLSWAILQQASLQYIGKFMDDALVIDAGLRMPFFRRNLNQNCFTTSAGGFIDCIGGDAAAVTAYATANPYSYNATTNAVTGFAPPQQRIFNYDKLLPSFGFTYRLTDDFSVFGNFSQGLSVPGTDNLYQSFYYPVGTPPATPRPETTDNFDVGVRFRSGKIQAQFSGFYNQFQNRLASAYDPELNQSVYRNLGNVKKYGLDGSIAFQPIDQLTFYVFGNVLKSEIKDNVEIGRNLDLTPIYAPTAGKYESGAPKYTFGASLRGELGPVEIGLTAKRTGERYIYDTNEALFVGSFIPVGAKACSSTTSCTTPVLSQAQSDGTAQVFPKAAPAYWLVNLDARLNLEFLGLNDKTHIQLNVYNLFDQFYVGGFGGNLNQNTSGSYNTATGTWSYGSLPFVQIGAPRTISASVVFAF